MLTDLSPCGDVRLTYKRVEKCPLPDENIFNRVVKPAQVFHPEKVHWNSTGFYEQPGKEQQWRGNWRCDCIGHLEKYWLLF